MPFSCLSTSKLSLEFHRLIPTLTANKSQRLDSHRLSKKVKAKLYYSRKAKETGHGGRGSRAVGGVGGRDYRTNTPTGEGVIVRASAPMRTKLYKRS